MWNSFSNLCEFLTAIFILFGMTIDADKSWSVFNRLGSMGGAPSVISIKSLHFLNYKFYQII